jgi:glycosyltransferase involved in cell wall biosynthesis
VPKVSIALVVLADQPTEVRWTVGPQQHCQPAVAGLRRLYEERLRALACDFVLFWDVDRLGPPSPARVRAVANEPGDVWHAGLSLGQQGQPDLIHCVRPTWMLNADPDPEHSATSWRLSLRACLVRHTVLAQLPFIDGGFASLDAAALELGFRYIRQGVLVRYSPALVVDQVGAPRRPALSAADQLRFCQLSFGRKWAAWALFRAIASNALPAVEAARAWRSINGAAPPASAPFRPRPVRGTAVRGTVSVIIPTIRRYPYLRTVLRQLGQQTVPPRQVIVVDQTPAAERDTAVAAEFPELPLQVVYLDRAGQSSARNRAVAESQGEFLLFIDDDDEVAPDLIERHLESFSMPGVDASCGVADEVDMGPLPEDFERFRVSDVFPTNNAMLRRDALRRSGLFDARYDQKMGEDGELGTRLYLSGALMVLNPDIRVLHHHAPQGGLRTWGARAITLSNSKRSLKKANLVVASEIYYAQRYFGRRAVREMLWIRSAALPRVDGGRLRQAVKAGWLLVQTPLIVRSLRRAYREAQDMLRQEGTIAALDRDEAPQDARTNP